MILYDDKGNKYKAVKVPEPKNILKSCRMYRGTLNGKELSFNYTEMICSRVNRFMCFRIDDSFPGISYKKDGWYKIEVITSTGVNLLKTNLKFFTEKG